MVWRKSSLPTLLNTMSNFPLPFTFSENWPSSLVRNMATGLSVLPALNTRTVAKGSASPKVSSINTPFTVVWAITTADRVSIIITAKILICFIPFIFLFIISPFHLFTFGKVFWCKDKVNILR